MSNERVTCVVLIGCGLSLEGVAGVDQEGPPGEAGAKAGFAKCLSDEALQIAMKRREVKGKGEKERYTHLNAEFQSN